MNYEEFSQKIKAKYPGSYDDMDDRTLAQKMIQKFPQYSDVTFDQAPIAEENTPWSDVPGNALEGLKKIGRGLKSLYEVGKMSPQELHEGFKNTALPILQDPKTNPAWNAIPHPTVNEQTGDVGYDPGEIYKGAKSFAQHPIETFKKNPVDTALIAAPVIGKAAKLAGPLLRGAAEAGEVAGKAGAGAEELNWLQRKGAQMANANMGIRPTTIESMTPRMGNTYDTGTKLGASLVNEGVMGSDAGTTLTRAQTMEQSFGHRVGKALEKIKNTGISTELRDDTVLQPIYDAWQELKQGTYSISRRAAKPFGEMYNKLVSVANESDGNLSLDDITKALRETGKALEAAPAESEVESQLSKLYGHLAEVRMKTVQEIASQVKDPGLAKELLDANSGFSKYARILPDLKRSASKAATSSSMFKGGNMLEATTRMLAPNSVAKGTVKLGTAIKNLRLGPVPAEIQEGAIAAPLLSNKTLEDATGSRYGTALTGAAGAVPASRILGKRKRN